MIVQFLDKLWSWDGNDMQTLIIIVYVIAMLVLGVVCLLYPEKIQRIAIRSVHQGLTKNSPLEAYIRSRRYLAIPRFVGIISILQALFLIWVLCADMFGKASIGWI